MLHHTCSSLESSPIAAQVVLGQHLRDELASDHSASNYQYPGSLDEANDVLLYFAPVPCGPLVSLSMSVSTKER